MLQREAVCVAPLLYNLSAIDGSCASQKRGIVYGLLRMLKASGDSKPSQWEFKESLELRSPERLVVSQWLSRHLTDGGHSRSKYVALH